eukprot:gene35285-45691_t
MGGAMTLGINPSFSSLAFAEAEVTEIQRDCKSESNPQTTTTFCRKLGLIGGRLRGCDANENCISTSAKAASKYGPPWTYAFIAERDRLYDPWETLRSALLEEGLTILQSREDTGYILAAEKNVPRQPKGASLFYEFLLKRAESDRLVLYRAVVDKTVFVYPLQQPVSDFGALENRLQGVFQRTGWLKIGE